MAKRRHVTFEEPEWGEETKPPRKRVASGGPGSRFPGQPSLDSDEEEEEEEEEAEGCPQLWGLGEEPGPEGAWPEGAGPVPLTPFNLQEELGEGRFDPQGHFLPHPRPGPRDPWSESLEGVQVRPRPPGEPLAAPAPPPPLAELLGGVLRLLRPGETLGGALRRLGGRGQERKRRTWPRPRPAPELEELAGLADGLVAQGLLGALDESRERLRGRLRALRGLAAGGEGSASGDEGSASGDEGNAAGEGASGEGETTSGEGASGGAEATSGGAEAAHGGAEAADATSAEGEMTSGGVEATSGEGKGASGGGEATSGEGDSISGDVTTREPQEEEVLWEYRWVGEGSPQELYGPFSSSQMQAWASQGYFSGGAECRRLQPLGPFYDCSRIDFELYT